MIIPSSTLEEVLGLYKPEYRYLTASEFVYPDFKGTFSIPHTCYTSEDVHHFTAVELILCCNQLTYTSLVEGIKSHLIPELRHLSLEQFRHYALSSGFIVGMDDIRFRKPINPIQFQGTLHLQEIITKKQGALYFFKTYFDFENGKATGKIDFALKFS